MSPHLLVLITFSPNKQANLLLAGCWRTCVRFHQWEIATRGSDCSGFFLSVRHACTVRLSFYSSAFVTSSTNGIRWYGPLLLRTLKYTLGFLNPPSPTIWLQRERENCFPPARPLSLKHIHMETCRCLTWRIGRLIPCAEGRSRGSLTQFYQARKK